MDETAYTFLFMGVLLLVAAGILALPWPKRGKK